MFAKRAFFVAAVGLMPMGLTGCTQNRGSKPVAPADPSAAVDTPSGPAPTAAQPKVKVRASVENVEDMFAAVSEISARIDPDDATDAKAEIQAQLLQTGFAPGFLESIDLAGLHAVVTAFPAGEAGGPNDTEIAATVAAKDPRKMIESTPAQFRPAPLGDGVWEFRQDDNHVLFREAASELLVGLTNEDLAKAEALRAEVGQGRRIRVRGWDIPVDSIDPIGMFGLPRDMPASKNAEAVFKGLKSVELRSDFGTARDFEVEVVAEAPFHILGVEPLGTARTAPTALEQRLPGDPVLVTAVSWGKPDLIHSTLDRVIPVDQLPAPFADVVRQAIKGVHGMLDQVANDVVVALYVDAKGQASVLVAADVKDEAAAKLAMREVNAAIVAAVTAQKVLAGDNKALQFSVDYRAGNLSLPGGKADRLTVTVPKDFEGDFDAASIFFKKNALDSISFVQGQTAVVLIGAGGKALASDVAKNLGKSRRSSLGGNEGLARLRKTMGGCQVCAAGSPVAYLKMRLHLLVATSDDKAIVKQAKGHLSKMRRLDTIEDSGAGISVGRDQATFGMVVPEQTLFASKQSWAILREVASFVDSPDVVAVESVAPAPK